MVNPINIAEQNTKVFQSNIFALFSQKRLKQVYAAIVVQAVPSHSVRMFIIGWMCPGNIPETLNLFFIHKK